MLGDFKFEIFLNFISKMFLSSIVKIFRPIFIYDLQKNREGHSRPARNGVDVCVMTGLLERAG